MVDDNAGKQKGVMKEVEVEVNREKAWNTVRKHGTLGMSGSGWIRSSTSIFCDI